MIEHESDKGALPFVAPAKLSYTKPVLLVFGQVAALTRSGSGCDANDNVCSGATGTRGPSPMASDCNVKERVVRVGDHPLGIGLYLFDYKADYRQKWGYGRQFGVMAQEVEAILPAAVSTHPDGYKMVDYGMLGMTPGCTLTGSRG